MDSMIRIQILDEPIRISLQNSDKNESTSPPYVHVRLPVELKENSEFKIAVFCLEFDIVSQPASNEGVD